MTSSAPSSSASSLATLFGIESARDLEHSSGWTVAPHRTATLFQTVSHPANFYVITAIYTFVNKNWVGNVAVPSGFGTCRMRVLVRRTLRIRGSKKTESQTLPCILILRRTRLCLNMPLGVLAALRRQRSTFAWCWP